MEKHYESPMAEVISFSAEPVTTSSEPNDGKDNTAGWGDF